MLHIQPYILQFLVTAVIDLEQNFHPQVFEQRHHWAAELGPALCIGLSTIRFRSNDHSCHEVFIDDTQLQWFEQTLAAAGDRPVVVFTHAPVMGCGVKAVEVLCLLNS